MSVDPISSSGSAPYQQVKNDYQTLSQALQAGNITAAQKAYSSIQQDQQNGAGQLPAGSQASTDFTALGQALQSGNLSGAQQAFASLQNDFQALRQSGGGHHGGGGEGDQDSSSSSSTPNASKTITNETTAVNTNGTITVTTTYSDGTTSTDTEPNPNPPVTSQNPLAPNSAQLSTLLNAQEQTSQTQQTN